LVLRVWPPDFSNLAHSRVRCSGVISASGFANSSGDGMRRPVYDRSL
jgi:hypothetical protein